MYDTSVLGPTVNVLISVEALAVNGCVSDLKISTLDVLPSFALLNVSVYVHTPSVLR